MNAGAGTAGVTSDQGKGVERMAGRLCSRLGAIGDQVMVGYVGDILFKLIFLRIQDV